MTGNKVNFDQAKAETAAPAGSAQTSTISFPNVDLDAAVAIARFVYARAGLGQCPLDELAAEASVTISGSFRVRTAAAKTFGFTEKDGQSAVKLTDLGARVVSEDGEADARAAAFMNVPLFSQIYEKYRGKLLPPTKALEREMVTLGVLPTMATQARQIMQRSARQAGYFGSGEDRLVRPRATGAVAETLDQSCGRRSASSPRRRSDAAERRRQQRRRGPVSPIRSRAVADLAGTGNAVDGRRPRRMAPSRGSKLHPHLQRRRQDRRAGAREGRQSRMKN